MNEFELYIEKYLSGEITAEESEKLLHLVNTNEEKQKYFSDACQSWYSLQDSKFNANKAFESFQKTTKPKAKIIPLWKKISAVAAVAILAIGCFSIFNKAQINTVTVANNEIAVKKVALPDGSAIFLQHGSSVTYPEEFEKENRTVSITGNVFCDIARDESAPFSVLNKELTIKVLGTSFQVNTSDSVYVVVESGRVQVSANDQSVVIEKGERADLRNNQLIASQNEDINYMSWITGALQFRNTNLHQVYSDLSRHYNCEFLFSKNCTDIDSFNLTGSYEALSLEEVLQTIEMAIPEIRYGINNNHTVLVRRNK